MRNLTALQDFVDSHFRGRVTREPHCSCGDSNHVRVFFFRVDCQPVAAIVPETAYLSSDEIRSRLGAYTAEPLDPADLPAIFADTELGHMQIFENPFGTQVFFDQRLLGCKELVFCPRMFLGEEGECFRIPTREFLDLSHARVLPLTRSLAPEPNAWAV